MPPEHGVVSSNLTGRATFLNKFEHAFSLRLPRLPGLLFQCPAAAILLDSFERLLPLTTRLSLVRPPCLFAVISILYASSPGGFSTHTLDWRGCCPSGDFHSRIAKAASRQVCRRHFRPRCPFQLPLVPYAQTLFAGNNGTRCRPL